MRREDGRFAPRRSLGFAGALRAGLGAPDPGSDEGSDEEETVTVTVSMDIFGEPLAEDHEVPLGKVRPRRLLPVIRSLAETVITESARRVREEGKTISCRAGCGACCRQLVPVARTEAYALRDVVEQLPASRRAEVHARFEDARRRLADAGLLDRLRDLAWVTDADLEPLGLEYLRQSIVCPFLEAGSCSIYEDRPIACREYLVTSPAERCAAPTRDTVALVPLAGEISKQVSRMESPLPRRGPVWIPLALALEWADGHPEPLPQHTGSELLAALLRPAAEGNQQQDTGRGRKGAKRR